MSWGAGEKAKFKNHLSIPQIVEIAMVADVNKGMSILNRRHERWGDHNLMELSYVGQLRAFIASKNHHNVWKSTKLSHFVHSFLHTMRHLKWFINTVILGEKSPIPLFRIKEFAT